MTRRGPHRTCQGTCQAGPMPLTGAFPWTRSSVVEHCVDIAGVAGSIPAASTIFPINRLRSVSCTIRNGPAHVCRAPVRHHAINHKKTGLAGPVIAVWKGGVGAPGTIRTSDPQIRSLMLYPAELRARIGEARLVGFF